MVLFLVINEQSIDEPYILDICKNEEYAENLKQQYIENFIKNTGNCNFIKVRKLNTDTNNEVLWSMYS